MDFEEYLNLQSEKFVQLYRCLPVSFLKKGNANDDGNMVIMPESALDRLGYLHIEYPMQFQIQNANTLKTLHCGVLEFTAEEGFIHVPTMIMQQLDLKQNDLVLLQSKALPKATFVKLQPHTSDFGNVPEPRYLLEYNFRKYVCLTPGETIAVTASEGDKTYYLNVLETQPADAVCTLETDCHVDFERALDHAEPMAMQVEHDDEPEPARFTGVAMRMDGKPVEEEEEKRPATAAAAAAVEARPKRGIRFGPPVAAGGVKEKAAGEEDGGKRFTGKRYSLQD